MPEEYLRVTPARAELARKTARSQLDALHGLRDQPEGLAAALPGQNPDPPIIEFLAISTGAEAPVEFYYRCEGHEDSLAARLTTLYPETFDVSRVAEDPLERLPDNADAIPRGVTWHGDATRSADWMLPLQSFVSAVGEGGTSSRAPLAPLVDWLAAVDEPAAFQALFRPRPDWQADAIERRERLKDGTDRLRDRIASELLAGVVDESPDEPPDPDARQRLDALDDVDPHRTFTANLRAVVLSEDPPEHSLETLAAVFDHCGGRFYAPTGKRLWRGRYPERTASQTLTRLRDREIVTDRWGSTRTQLTLGADELANFVIVPSAGDLNKAARRAVETRAATRSPLPKPRTSHLDAFDDGMAIGYPKSDAGRTTHPVRLPPRLLRTHYLRAATTGAGKSTALVNDALSAHAATRGPTILIDPKGDGMCEEYMRAHAARFGIDDLESTVRHFPMPAVLPGIAFFTIEDALADGTARVDAVQAVADHYQEVLELAMGTDRFERAIVAPRLLTALVVALFDEDHGRENGLYRESADYFAHSQLEHAVDELRAAGPPNPNPDAVPQTSDAAARRTLRRQVDLDAGTFSTVLGGLDNRLDYVSQDAHLRRLFETTQPQFSFRDVLETDRVVLFDLGDLRDAPARLVTGVLLTQLQSALQATADVDRPADHVVNLIIDEAATVAVADVMNDLLEKGRSFGLSVGLSMQFPEQIREQGDRQAYLNVLNDVGTTIVGNIAVDREIARAMAHEGMDAETVATRIRSLPRGEWIASLPSPRFGETGPEPFSLAPLDEPSTDDSPAADRATDRVTRATADACGLPDRSPLPDPLPDAVADELSAETLADALATACRSVRLRQDAGDATGVPAPAIDAELAGWYDAADADADPPTAAQLATVRRRSRLFDVDDATDPPTVTLTPAGEDAAATDTGASSPSGSDRHDSLLEQSQAALTALGFSCSILQQDGSAMPDAKAVHPHLDAEFAIEAETTTPEKPAKVLRNLQRAQREECVPVFVVEAGDDDPCSWARRVDNIMQPPVKSTGDERSLYITGEALAFGGGSRTKGGATAARPAGDDSRRSVWIIDGQEYVLRDTDGTEHARLEDMEHPSKDRVPAYYSYDPATAQYTVYEAGNTTSYDTRDAFEADWVRVRRPFVPEVDLPYPDVDPETYAIVVMPTAESDLDESRRYADGDLRSLSSLVESPPRLPGAVPVIDADPLADDPDAAVAAFAADCLRETPGASVPAADVYDAYVEWAEDRKLSVESKSWFGRRLKRAVEVDRKLGGPADNRCQVYVGIEVGGDSEKTEERATEIGEEWGAEMDE